MPDNEDTVDNAAQPDADESAPVPPANAAIAAVVRAFPEAVVTERSYASSDVTYHRVEVPVDSWVGIVQAARLAGFDMFIDLYAVDHFSQAPRFEVGLNVLSMGAKERLILTTRIPYDEPSVPTITGEFAGANFYEREAYDLFGIVFPGHPDLTRILLPDDWDGYPLRKDYDIGAIPVQFKAGSADL
jgi:NADH-quinone oxidoreductase subunit C